MPELGMTKLQAVNQLLRTVYGTAPTTALDPGGASIEGQAESYIDDMRLEVCERGLPDNTDQHQRVGPGNPLLLPSDTLAIKPVGASRGINLVIRDGKLYDANNGTFNILQQQYIDIAKDVPWEKLSPELKRQIVQEAKVIFQRRVRANAQVDAALRQELDITMFHTQRRIAVEPSPQAPRYSPLPTWSNGGQAPDAGGGGQQ